MNYRSSLLVLLVYCNWCTANTFTVINTNDAGPGSLRQAMLDANADVNPPRIINFNIPGGVPQIITPLTTLPTIAVSMSIDGTTQLPGWVFGDNMPIVIDCSTLAIVTPNGGCFTINSASNCLIRGFAIKSYVGVGVNGRAILIRSTTAQANNNQIKNCYLGANADGSTTGPGFVDNTRSVIVAGNATFSINNTIIGGPNSTDGNLFVSASVNAIDLQFNVQDTIIQNNLFGTDITGTIAVGENPYDIAIFGSDGILTNVPVNGTIIRNNVLSNNLLANAAAINLIFNVNNTIIENNKIGTNIAGTAIIPGGANAGAGINTIGTFSGPTSLPVSGTVIASNVIAGNPQGGIVLNDLTSDTTISNNQIGTDITGTTAIPNSIGVFLQGDLQGANFPVTNNIIGPNNIISGNTGQGVIIADDAISTLVQNNTIGLTSSQAVLANSVGIEATNGSAPFLNDIVFVTMGYNNIPTLAAVSGTNIRNNAIGGNTTNGIELLTGTVQSIIQANTIGTDITGTLMLGNGSSGILIQGSAGQPCTNNLIGGTSSADANIIKFNGTIVSPSYGIILQGDAGDPDVLNSILGNTLYLNNNNGIKLLNNSNNLQQPPTIISADLSTIGNNQVRVIGIAPVAPASSNFRLEFFINPTDRNPITEGDRFIGAIDPIGSGQPFDVIFTVPTPAITPGTWLSATATNLNNSGNTPGDTSEYSLNAQLGSFIPVTVEVTAQPNPVCAGSPTVLTATFTGVPPFTLTWSDGLVQVAVSSPVTRIIEPLFTATYSVTVIDSLGSTSTSDPVVIAVNSIPFVEIVAQPATIMQGQSSILTATPTGNGPFTLVWSDGFVQTEVTGPVTRIVTPQVTTEYNATIIDANGCQFDPPVGVVITVLSSKKRSKLSIKVREKYCSASTIL